MISTIHFDDCLPYSEPFSLFGDMESEIAELRTMTRVTKLRKQIECRQEGAWMMVRDVPDERSKTGKIKVTSYGRASRSVIRSFSSNVDIDHHSPFNTIISNGSIVDGDKQVLVEFPPEEPSPPPKPSDLEIVELTEEPENRTVETKTVPEKTSPVKKTSVVTLGKGNLVLIDPEDSNFQVTGISKGKVAEAVSTLERAAEEKSERKAKKVGFSKTEVHFAPDSGKVNIVETDEKPPPNQVLRRKKRPSKAVSRKSSLPKLYFGDDVENTPTEGSVESSSKVTEHLFPVIREPSPLLSTSFTTQSSDRKSWCSKTSSEKKDWPSKRISLFHEPVSETKDWSTKSSSLFLDHNSDKREWPTKSCSSFHEYSSKDRDWSTKSSLLFPEPNSEKKDRSTKSRSLSNEFTSEMKDWSSPISHEASPEKKVWSTKSSPLFPEPGVEKRESSVMSSSLFNHSSSEKKGWSSRSSPLFPESISEEKDKPMKPSSLFHESNTDYGTGTSPSSRGLFPHTETKRDNRLDFLGHVSPKLSKLIQNSIQHEFQLKQMQIMGKIKSETAQPSSTSPSIVKNVAVNIQLWPDIEDKSLKNVTQAQLSQNEIKTKEFDVETSEPSKTVIQEPLYINSEVVTPGEMKKPVRVVKERDKTPKPKPRTSITKINSVESKESTKKVNRGVVKSPPQQDSSLKRTPVRAKETPKREVAQVRPLRSCPRISTTNTNSSSNTITLRQSELSKKNKVKTEVVNTSQKLQKLIKNTNDKNEAIRSKKSREPLRSFEKVSNGWVGHCIVPIKPLTKTADISITTNVYTAPPTSAKIQGSKRNTVSMEPKPPPRTKSEDKSNAKSTTLTTNKFSLSREHLRSAKLVKELTKEARIEKPIESPLRKAGDLPKPRVNVVRPRIIQDKTTVSSAKPKVPVTRRRLHHYEDNYGRLRRDSEQSDDSVVRADEEVRAYMFNTRHKVFNYGAGL